MALCPNFVPKTLSRWQVEGVPSMADSTDVLQSVRCDSWAFGNIWPAWGTFGNLVGLGQNFLLFFPLTSCQT